MGLIEAGAGYPGLVAAVHLLSSCPPAWSPANVVKYLKERSSRMLQEEFPHLVEKVLWSAALGPRVLLRYGWSRYRRHDKRVRGEPTGEGPEDTFKIGE